MGDKTGIPWTDATWNPWHGCVKISPGCKFCYMYRDKERYGQDGSVILRSKTKFSEPLQWKEPRKVFTCSWSDFFLEQADQWRAEAWGIIRQSPHLTYQILTKRPERIGMCLPADWGDGWKNVWLGVSVESQKYADRIALLLGVRSAVRFLSYEPALEELWVEPYLNWGRCGEIIPCLNWVICGGESGKLCRPSKASWFRGVLQQCRDTNTAFFMKQLGGHPNPRHNMEDFPADLRVREFPGG